MRRRGCVQLCERQVFQSVKVCRGLSYRCGSYLDRCRTGIRIGSSHNGPECLAGLHGWMASTVAQTASRPPPGNWASPERCEGRCRTTSECVLSAYRTGRISQRLHENTANKLRRERDTGEINSDLKAIQLLPCCSNIILIFFVMGMRTCISQKVI